MWNREVRSSLVLILIVMITIGDFRWAEAGLAIGNPIQSPARPLNDPGATDFSASPRAALPPAILPPFILPLIILILGSPTILVNVNFWKKGQAISRTGAPVTQEPFDVKVLTGVNPNALALVAANTPQDIKALNDIDGLAAIISGAVDKFLMAMGMKPQDLFTTLAFQANPSEETFAGIGPIDAIGFRQALPPARLALGMGLNGKFEDPFVNLPTEDLQALLENQQVELENWDFEAGRVAASRDVPVVKFPKKKRRPANEKQKVGYTDQELSKLSFEYFVALRFTAYSLLYKDGRVFLTWAAANAVRKSNRFYNALIDQLQFLLAQPRTKKNVDDINIAMGYFRNPMMRDMNQWLTFIAERVVIAKET